ncbi:MAG: helix-turn-helix domain-containing protein, partial [Nodosilinea sp.]
MKKKVLLTYNEASILRAFGDTIESSVPALAVEAHLTPTEMRDAVSRLENKRLVSTFNHGYFVRLTPQGEDARLNW